MRTSYLNVQDLKSAGRLRGLGAAQEWVKLRNAVTGEELEGWSSAVYTSSTFLANPNAWTEVSSVMKEPDPADPTKPAPGAGTKILNAFAGAIANLDFGALLNPSPVTAGPAAPAAPSLDQIAAEAERQRRKMINVIAIGSVVAIVIGGVVWAMTRRKGKK